MEVNKQPVKRFLNPDIIFSALCFLFFLVMLIETFRMEVPSTYLLPRGLSVMGIILVSAIWITNLNKILTQVAEFKESKKKFTGINVYLSVLFTSGYFLLVPVLGYILSTFINILGFTFIIRYQNKKIAFITAILLPLILYFLFGYLLKVSLPQGVFETIFS